MTVVLYTHTQNGIKQCKRKHNMDIVTRIQARNFASCLEKSLERSNPVGISLGRHYCTKVAAAENSDVKPFSEIPGPKGIPGLGIFYKYLPGGEYNTKDRSDCDWKKFQKYGEIMKEEIYKGFTIVNLFHPDDIEQIYRNEGKYPFRGELNGHVKYCKEKGIPMDLTSRQGQEWADIRMPISKVVMKPKVVARYIPDQDLVARDLVSLIQEKRDSSNNLEILPELYKYALEAAGVLLYHQRLGMLKLQLDPLSAKIFQSVNDIFHGIYHCLLYWPLHKNGKSRTWKKFKNGLDFMFQLGDKYSEEAMKSDNTSERKSLAYQLEQAGASKEDALAGVNALLQGAVDTTGNTMTFFLYNLARYPEAQENVQKLIDQVFPDKDTPLSEEGVKQMSYLRACIKESMRLTPTALGSHRILSKDVVIRNYRIPAGVVISLQNAIVGKRPDFFRTPDRFIPERWMRGQGDKVHPYGAIQFSHGPRMCPGKRLAEQEMLLGTIRILQSFNVSYSGPQMSMKSKILNEPDQPLVLKFTDR